MRNSRFLMVLACTALALPLATHASTIVSPVASANSNGDSRDPGPFGLGDTSGTAGSHAQVVYNSSLFAGITGPITISGFALRQHNGGIVTSRSRTISEAVIQLSTTASSENTLSPTFASNVGANAMTVFDGALNFTTNNTTPTPGNFEFVVTFATPFVYLPSAGNLLLDVTVPTGASIVTPSTFSSLFDSINGANDGEASVGNTNTAAGATGVALTTPITQFTYTAVPEPTSLAMIAIAGAALVRRRRA